MPNKIDALYAEVSKTYDVGSIQDFQNYLADPKKRQLFFKDVIAPEYDVKSLDEFEQIYGLKKKESVSPSQQKKQPTSSATGAMEQGGAPAPSQRKKYNLSKADADLNKRITASQQVLKPSELTPDEAMAMAPMMGKVAETSTVVTPKKDEGYFGGIGRTLAGGVTEEEAKQATIPGPQYELEYKGEKVDTDIVNKVIASTYKTLGAIAGTPNFAYDVTKAFMDPVQKATLMSALEPVMGQLKEANIPEKALKAKAKEMESKMQKVEGDVSDRFSRGDYADGFRLLSNELASSAPQMLGVMLSGGGPAGMTLLGLSSAEMRADDLEGQDITDKQKYANALAYGGAEVLFELVGAGSMARVTKNIIKREGPVAGKEIVKKGILDVVDDLTVKYPMLFGSSAEGLSEMATTIAQNAADKYGGIDPERDLMEGTADAFIAGNAMGLGLGGVVKLAQTVLPQDKRDQVAKNQQDILKAKDLIVDPNISEEKRTALQQLVNKKIQENENLQRKAFEKLSFIPEDVRKEYASLRQDAMDLESEIESEVDPVIKEALELELQSRKSQIKKIEEDAIQKQATSKVPVQPEAPVGGEVAEGEPQAEPEVVTEEGQAKEEIAPGSKAVVSGIEITYPTQQQRTEREAVRNSQDYVSAKSAKLPVTDTVELRKNLEGEFAMVTGENPDGQPLTEEENQALNERAQEWLVSRGYDPKPIVGKFNQAENSFFVKGMTEADAIEFAQEFNQKSVAHSGGMLYQDGTRNPRTSGDDFSFGRFEPDMDMVSIVNTTEGPKQFSVAYDFKTTLQPEMPAFDQAVNNSAQSLKMVAPDLKIIVSENTEDAQLQIAEALSAVAPSQAADVAEGFTTETRGQTVFVNGKPFAIVLDKSQADSKTVGHEAWEVMLNDAFGDDQAKFKEFRDEIDRQLRLKGFGDIADALTKFSNQRGYEDVKYSEYMAELGGMLVANGFKQGSLDAKQKSLLQKIGDVINKFAQLFTGKKQFLDEATPDDILGFMITISNKVAKGEDVSQFFRGETPGATMDGGIIAKSQIGPDSVDDQFDMSIQYDDSNMPDKLIMPDVETIEKVLEESGGAAVFINSDGTKVGITRDNKKLQGGWRYTYFKENIDDNIGFAATSETHVGTFHKLIQQIAKERDELNPSMKGKPIAVFVTVQNAESMLGEWYAGEFLMDGIDKAITEKKTTVAKARKLMDTAIVDAQKRYIDSERKLSESKGKTRTLQDIKSDSQYKQLEKLKSIIKEKGFDTHDGRIKAAKVLGSKDFSFKFRSSFLSELIPLKAATGKNQEIKKLLLDVGYGRKDFYKDTMDEVLYDALEKSNFKESSIGGTTLGGFYADPYVTKEAFLKNKNKGIQHEMFNESFSSNGKTFRLDKARNVNKLFPSMGFPDAKGYSLYNEANNSSESKASGIIGKNKVTKWLLANGYEKNVTNPFTAISGTMYTSTIDEDYQKKEPSVTAKSQKSVPAVVDEVLTDDGKGNYVFVHYSDEKRDTIKPMSGSKKNFTSREEVAAISSVGGVAMYYTKQGQKEQGVGDVPHTVLVPKDKVYFYGTTERGKVSNDPENFYPEARRRFQEYKNRGNESRPTEYAFDANNAAAWITKVAAENGYDMVVTNWGPPMSYRAQTVKELTPEAEYTGFKQIPEPKYEVGDEVFLYGQYVTLKDVKPDVLTYETEAGYGKYPLTVMTRDKIIMVQKAKPTVTTKSQKVVVNTIPGYERMMGEVEGILEKTMNSRNGSYNRATAAAIGYIQRSKVYIDADDSQREQIIRDFLKIRGEKFKVAPSVGKIMGQIKDVKKVSVNEKTALKDQIKLEAKAAKDAVAFVKQLRVEISGRLKIMAGRGVISAKQASSILARYDKMNILNPDMRDRFVDYMANVFQSAEYADKVKEANKYRKAIKKASKSADNQAENSKMAKSFAEIDPSRVENIDDYINNAEQMLKAVSRKTGDVKMRSLINMTDMVSYIDGEIQAQREQIKNEILSKYQDLVDAGVLDSKMTINEIKKVVDAIEENEDESAAKAKEAKEAVKKMMDQVSPILLQIARTGEDPFTGDPIDLTADEKDAIVKLAKMDLDNLSLSDSVKALEYANNFIANGITSGIVGMVKLNEGATNTAKLQKKGFKSISIKKYFSPGVGRVWMEQIASLPMVNKLMWGTTSRAIEVAEASGVTGVSNGKAKAIKIVERAVKEYVSRFSKVKDFLSSENVVERGMLAFVSRTVIGDEFQAQDEFNRRKSLIEETIQALKDPENSTDAEIKKGEVVEKVYNKILKNAKNAKDVRANVSDINKKAVDWWVNEWSKHYDRMDEVSRNVYNTLLSRDANFTPDRFQLKEVSPAKEEDFDSGFFGNFENVSTEKSGSLKENKRIKNLPQNKNGVKTRIVNLDFDVNNVNALTNAMVDIETAGSVMQMKGFVTSKDFGKLFSNKDDKNVYKKRLVSYVNRVKGQGYVDQSELKSLNRLVNTVASFGTAKALFSLSQPFKQSIPPLFNTLIQTGRVDIGTLMNGGFSFIDKTGYPIANRGISSQGELKSINRQLVEAEKNLLLRGVDGIAQYSNLMLELTLKYPDIMTARSSWLSFYKKGIKKEGIKTSDINWNTHEVNKKAADYAQMMVDSQQNISDSDMQGEFMASKDPAKAFLRRAIFPLMTFVLNQKTRIWADIRTLSNKGVATTEDRQEAALSLSGALVELAAFSAISYAANSMLWEIGMNVLDMISGEDDEEDKEEEKKKMILRRSAYTAQNFMKDFFLPPIPGADLIASKGVNYVLDETGLADEIPSSWFGIEDERVKFRLYDKANQGYLDMLGTQGIALEKALELADYYNLAIDGKYTDEKYGGKKQLLEGDVDMARINAAVMTGYYGGLLPADVAYIIGQINKKIRKRAETAEEED